MEISFRNLLNDLSVQKTQGNLDISIASLAYDSRKIGGFPRSLFIALRGTQTDGHRYISDVVDAGAVALLVEDIDQVPSDIPAAQVSNTREDMARIASKFFDFPSRNLSLIGITGTNGKTTISYLLEHVLRH